MIEIFRIHRLSIPLVRPFRTSFGTEVVRDVILVEAVSSDGTSGWGECTTMSWPGYSYEYGDSAVDVIAKHLLPALAECDDDPYEVRAALEVVRGHPMAKTALSTAMLDVWLRERGESLAHFLGAEKEFVDSGVSVGIPTTESVRELLDDVLDGLQVTLGDAFVGLYVRGSLALGDFDDVTSDVDQIGRAHV